MHPVAKTVTKPNKLHFNDRLTSLRKDGLCNGLRMFRWKVEIRAAIADRTGMKRVARKGHRSDPTIPYGGDVLPA